VDSYSGDLKSRNLGQIYIKPSDDSWMILLASNKGDPYSDNDYPTAEEYGKSEYVDSGSYTMKDINLGLLSGWLLELTESNRSKTIVFDSPNTKSQLVGVIIVTNFSDTDVVNVPEVQEMFNSIRTFD
jgi:hypothetical protein